MIAATLEIIPQTPGMRNGPQTSGAPGTFKTVSVTAISEICLMPPVQRRQRSNEAHKRYDENKLLTESETTSLNTVDEPITTSASRQPMTVANMTANTGIEVRESTYYIPLAYICNSWVYQLTFLRIDHPGIPRSLAKAKIIREQVATPPTVAEMARITTMEAMMALPAIDLVAWWNISMNGYPVGVARTASRSVKEKRAAIIMANPRLPFSAILIMIDRGTRVDALRISSAI